MEVVASIVGALIAEAARHLCSRVYSTTRGCLARIVAVSCAKRAVEHIPGPSIEDQTTASGTLEKIMDLLNDDGVRRIGIWGMGGVGKTTLVRNLNNKLRNDPNNTFGLVIWSTVSKEVDLKRIQTEIAKRLGMEVKRDESIQTVAIQLLQKLRKQGRFLLILDDVWEGIDLDALGVPQPEDTKGGKIIFTCRPLNVCREMKTDQDVKVDVLTDDEAWKLFCQNAGMVAELEHIKPLAEAIVQECAGLPLAINIMATSMRGKQMVELWKDALNELQKSVPSNIEGVEDKVYRTLKWSYDSLQGMNIKYCFLYCSLFPEDFSIEISQLVQYWIAEGLIDEDQSYEVMYNRGFALVENLKDCCLLEHGSRKDTTVKMHDVVRDVAIWIASSLEDECKSLVQSGIGLSKISEYKFTRSLKRISFMNNQISWLPDCGINCPEASALLLQGNTPLEKVPEGFLQGFPALKVLNLSGTRIQRLPLSLVHLGELRALLLRNCSFLEELPPVGGLSRLQVLDCASTNIKELPEGMEQLSYLRELHLSRTKQLTTIQAGVLSGLSSLEVLDMRGGNYKWGMKGKAKHGQAEFEELANLGQLTGLYINVQSTKCPSLESIDWIKRLKSFKICVGLSICDVYEHGHFDERMMSFGHLDLSREFLGWWLTNASSLFLDSCRGLNLMLETLAISKVDCFASLKKLTIMHSATSFRPAGGCGSQYDLLPNLEELYLHDLTFLESISELVGHLGLRFSRLRVMEVTLCPSLKYLLAYGGFILSLDNLDEVSLSHCEDLGDLFLYSSGDTSISDPVVPNLRVIDLHGLPNLRTFCRQEESWPHLEHLQVSRCGLLKKLPLNRQSATTIKEIRGEQEWWNQLEWDDDSTRLSLQHFFQPPLDLKNFGPS